MDRYHFAFVNSLVVGVVFSAISLLLGVVPAGWGQAMISVHTLRFWVDPCFSFVLFFLHGAIKSRSLLLSRYPPAAEGLG